MSQNSENQTHIFKIADQDPTLFCTKRSNAGHDMRFLKFKLYLYERQAHFIDFKKSWCNFQAVRFSKIEALFYNIF